MHNERCGKPDRIGDKRRKKGGILKQKTVLGFGRTPLFSPGRTNVTEKWETVGGYKRKTAGQ